MSREQEFLELYRTYESALRDAGEDYKTLEERSDDLLQNRMRMCRQMRNYLSHQNDAGFLSISESQLDFLRELIRAQELKGDILQNHIGTVRAGSCKPEDTLESAYRKMKRNKTDKLPVCEGTRVLGVLTLNDVMDGVFKQAVLVSQVKYTGEVCCKKPTQKMDTLSMNVVCCTDTGTVSGKCLGVWFR